MSNFFIFWKNELKSLEEEEKQSYESVKVRGKRKYHNDKASDDSSAEEVSPQKSSKRSRDQRSRDHKESSKHSKKVKHKKGEKLEIDLSKSIFVVWDGVEAEKFSANQGGNELKIWNLHAIPQVTPPPGLAHHLAHHFSCFFYLLI